VEEQVKGMTEELEKKEEQIRIIAKVLEEKDAAY